MISMADTIKKLVRAKTINRTYIEPENTEMYNNTKESSLSSTQYPRPIAVSPTKSDEEAWKQTSSTVDHGKILHC